MKPLHIIARTLLFAACITGCTAGCHLGQSDNTANADYETKVSAFTVSLIALDARDQQHDREYLTRFTQVAPEEPAGWANLGLKEIRTNNLSAAASDINKAAALAPGNAQLERLLSLLADRQGDSAGALSHAQAAVKAAPSDIRARYTLAKLLQRSGNPADDTAAITQYSAILNVQPSNMVAQLEIAVAAAKTGDLAALAKSVEMVRKHSTTFTGSSAKYFQQLATIASGKDPRPAMVPARYLQNTLVVNIAYADSFNALTRSEKEGVGDPVRQFIKLPPVTANPAPADLSSTFAPTPVGPSGGGFDAAGTFPINGDGKLAYYSANSTTVAISEGIAATLPFPGAGKPASSHGVLPLDANYDLKNDLALAGAGGFRLFLQKDGSFLDNTAQTKLPDTVVSAPATGAWAMDIDADGDLDIVLGHPASAPDVLRNNGDGTWAVVRPFAGIAGTKAFASADIDGDGSADVAMIDGSGKLHVFANDRGGVFHERALPAPVTALDVTRADIGRTGSLVFLALQPDGKIVSITDKDYGKQLEVNQIVAWGALPADIAKGAFLTVLDLDNNGALDIVASTHSTSAIWMGDEKGGFVSSPTPPTGAVVGIGGVASNGRQDLVGMAPWGSPVKLSVTGKTSYHWQELRPHAAMEEFDKAKYGDRRVNSFGIGAEVEARAGLYYIKMPVEGATVHFGLGTHKALDAVRVVWPNGDVRAEFAEALKPDQSIALPHRLHASCPFLFTWNGKEMKFVTDCIWRSALGLKINAQDTAGVAQTEDWVKIRSDQLQPNLDGKYDLRITAELWETHFFDHLSLLAVDHPIGTEVFVDERFAIPPPPHHVYVTGVPQAVRRATDDLGNDVTELVAVRDLKHVDTFGRGDYQGVTRDHWLEVELPENAPRTGQLWLICNGWIHPTSSSINVAIGQNPTTQKPQGLSLETPDAAGHWTPAKQGLGFPEGKVKTILVDLNGAFKPGAPRKLRLRTNLEIYWDCIQWAVGQPENAIRTTHLAASSAELRYRGFSQIAAPDASTPEMPVSYDHLLSTGQQWRDLDGYCTRFGDIKELLQKVDDRYVIMNAGDEMRLLFDAPPYPKSEMVRDFVLIGDGWVKDGDYNTTFSKTVIPLPAHDINNYNIPPRTTEDDPVYRKHEADWQTYQTRWITGREFGRSLKP